MSLYKSIFRRKSTRKYDLTPLESSIFGEIEEVLKSFSQLDNDISLNYRFTDKVKGLFHVNATHYLIISGNGQDREMENAGFLFEQLVLWLDMKGIGSVWLGGSKDAVNRDKKNDIITIGFGKSLENPHRETESFKRKPIERITNNIFDDAIKAVHLSPSGMNTQGWFYEFSDDKVFVYKQKLKPPVSLLYKLGDIDMGISLCHYMLALKEVGKEFCFQKTSDMKPKDGYVPFGIIENKSTQDNTQDNN